MGRDGTKRTTAKTATMDVDGVLDHLIGGNALVLVLGMGQTRIWQVERSIQFLCVHRRVGWIDNDIAATHLLNQSMRMHHIGLFLNMAEVLCL